MTDHEKALEVIDKMRECAMVMKEMSDAYE